MVLLIRSQVQGKGMKQASFFSGNSSGYPKEIRPIKTTALPTLIPPEPCLCPLPCVDLPGICPNFTTGPIPCVDLIVFCSNITISPIPA
jgi:hypothetical protein